MISGNIYYCISLKNTRPVHIVYSRDAFRLSSTQKQDTSASSPAKIRRRGVQPITALCSFPQITVSWWTHAQSLWGVKGKYVFMFHRRKSYMFEQLEFEFGWNIALRCSRHECARNPRVTVTLYFPLCWYRLCQRLWREVWCAEGPNGQGALIRSLVNTQMRCFTCSQCDDAVVIALVFRAPARLRRWRSRARRIRRPVRWKQVRRNTHFIIN